MQIRIERDVRITMRDGTALAADIYRPDVWEPLPVLLQRTPYNKDVWSVASTGADLYQLVRAGYVVVLQDTRGRFASEGTFRPFETEAQDGADTIEWLARQPWSSGKIGMIGASYFGATQWLAATQAPPGLAALAPFVTPANYHEGWVYRGGAFELGFSLYWTLLFLATGELERRQRIGGAGSEDLTRLLAELDQVETLFEHLPLSDAPALRELAPYYLEWLQHPAYDNYWRDLAPSEHYEQVTAPALNMGGWYDLFLGGTIQNFTDMRRRGGSEFARQAQHLVIGPWAHGVYSGTFPERSYGHGAGTDAFGLTTLQIRWFDHWLKGQDTGLLQEPPVQLFVMGSNSWRSYRDWPPPEAATIRYFLHSSGGANSRFGDGMLSWQAPTRVEQEDIYLYDPRHPVPTTGGATYLPGVYVGANAGPRDQRAIEERHDVLCYTSDPLADAIEVIGPVRLILFVSSSAPDTDFTGKFVDVAPDGRAECLCDGIVRMRYATSRAQPAFLQPGHIYEIEVDLGATAYRFARGHRMRVEVSSSNFPRFDRNLNTDADFATGDARHATAAVNRVHHTAVSPSHLLLWVMQAS